MMSYFCNPNRRKHPFHLCKTAVREPDPLKAILAAEPNQTENTQKTGLKKLKKCVILYLMELPDGIHANTND